MLGVMRWRRTLYIMVFAQMMSAVGFSIIFPFLPRYVHALGSEYGLSLDLLSALVFSAQAFTMMLASPVWGSLADRWGRKPMFQRATYSGAVILGLMALVPNAEMLVLLRAIQGCLTGTVAAANALIASNIPRKHTGYAMGLLQVGLSSGIAVGPFLGGVLADHFGFRVTFLLTSALLALSGLAVTFGVRDNFVRPSREDRKARPGILQSWRLALQRPQIKTLFTLSFFNWLGRNMLTPILPLFVVLLLPQNAHENTTIGLIMGTAAATGTLSAVYFGRLGDRVGQRVIVIGCTLCAVLFYLPQAFVTHIWHLLVLQALAGVAVGGLTPTLAALLTRRAQVGSEGVVFGLDNAIVSGSRTIAPLLAAAAVLLVRQVVPDFAYRSVFLLTGLCFLLATFLALWRIKPLVKAP